VHGKQGFFALDAGNGETLSQLCAAEGVGKEEARRRYPGITAIEPCIAGQRGG